MGAQQGSKDFSVGNWLSFFSTRKAVDCISNVFSVICFNISVTALKKICKSGFSSVSHLVDLIFPSSSLSAFFLEKNVNVCYFLK